LNPIEEQRLNLLSEHAEDQALENKKNYPNFLSDLAR